MKKRLERAGMTALLLCAVLSAFYLRADMDIKTSAIPVSRVFAVAATEAPAGGPGYRAQRDQQREQEMEALSAMTAHEEGAAAALQALIARAEGERAVENAMAALGHAEAVCALREDGALVCLKRKLSAQEAQQVIEVCATLCGIAAEKVFVLDGCEYL